MKDRNLLFKTLGMPELLADGQALRLRYRKAYVLLGHLAVERDRWHERRRIADLLWPDLASEAARANLRLVLKNLGDATAVAAGRQVLRVERERLGLFADAALDVDLHLFDEAQRSRLRSCARPTDIVALFAEWDSRFGQIEGEFLAGAEADEGGEFEDWLRIQRGAADHARSAFLQDCLAAARRCDAVDAALRTARSWVRCCPVDDAAACAQMELLAVVDGPAAALAAYADFARRVECLAGAQPAPVTEALRQRIAAAADIAATQPAARPAADEIRRVVVLHIEPELHDEADLLEPERSLAPLAAALDEALARWDGRRLPASGVALAAVFGLADDGEQAPRRALHAALELTARPAFSRARLGLGEGKALIASSGRSPIAGSILPALAQRLALAGEPGDLVAAAALAAEGGGFARFEAWPPRRFAGLAGEHACGRIVAGAESPAEPFRAAHATPFVGRGAELAALAQALAAAAGAGQTRFLDVAGPAGAGKSRLLAEFAAAHAGAGGAVRWIAHRPELRHAALGALREHLRRRGERVDDLAGRALAEALIARLFAPPAGSAPLLLVFDDLHWADAATQELLAAARRAAPAAPVLAVLARRPPAEDAAGTRLDLRPLAVAETAALIAAIDAEGRIDTLRRIQLAKMSGGLPLCAEYIARTARDQPVSDASLFGVLQGVLDRMGADKPVLQAAAVLGASFRVEFLRRILPEHHVAAALERAAALAIVADEGADRYAFRHALLRDCAYESAPPPQRRDWHHRAAQWLSQQPDAAPADIAQHYEVAHDWDNAFAAWRAAATAAYLDESAGDARHAAQRALDAAAKRGDRTASELADLELVAGYATLMSDGYGAKRAQKHFAAVLARPAGELSEETQFRALAGMVAAYPQGRSENMEAMQRLEVLAKKPAHRLNVHYGFGSLLFWRGEFAAALSHLDRAIETGTALPPREWLPYSADDPVVTCMALKAINPSFSAEAEAAIAAADAAVRIARRQGRIHGLCFALTLAACVHCFQDRPEDTARFAAEGLELASARQFQFWQAYNALFDLWAKARQGGLDLKKSFSLLSLHREIAAASRVSPVTSWWIVALVCEAIENWALLDMVATRAIALAESGGDTYCVPDLLRQRARVRQARGDAADAQRWLERAAALAQAQGARGLLARIARTAQSATAD